MITPGYDCLHMFPSEDCELLEELLEDRNGFSTLSSNLSQHLRVFLAFFGNHRNLNVNTKQHQNGEGIVPDLKRTLARPDELSLARGRG